MATAPKAALLPLEQRTTWTKNGTQVALKEPDGKASEAQVMTLYRRGVLAIVQPGQVKPFTKGEASYALDVTGQKS